MRSVHLGRAPPRRPLSYPSNEGKRVQSSPTLAQSASRPHLPPSELRALNEAAVRERRRRLAARHKELSFLSKAPLLASSLPPSLATTAPALPRTDFSYQWPSLAFQRIPLKQRVQPTEQPAYESVRQASHLRGEYERQLRERRGEKNKAVARLKQLINPPHDKATLAGEADRQRYGECLEEVKRIRQLYSPLLSSLDYYTLIAASGLCVHERLLDRLFEDAGIAKVQLPTELFARLMLLLATDASPAAVRCTTVVAHEFFRQQHMQLSKAAARGASEAVKGRRDNWQRLPLSAAQYGLVLLAVSKSSSTHLLLPLLDTFRYSNRRAQEHIPLVCATVLPALRQLSQQQHLETLLSLSSAAMRWEVVASSQSDSEAWEGSELSDVTELLQLHFGALLAAAVADESGRPLPVALPEAWLAHLPPPGELCSRAPALQQYRTASDAHHRDLPPAVEYRHGVEPTSSEHL